MKKKGVSGRVLKRKVPLLGHHMAPNEALCLHTAICTSQPGFSLQHSQAATPKKKMAQRLSPQPQFCHFRLQNALELHARIVAVKHAK